MVALPVASALTSLAIGFAPLTKSVTGTPSGLATFFNCAVKVTAVPCAGEGETVSGVSVMTGAVLVGVRLQVPSALVTFITRSLWVAKRQPLGPTVTRSPREPPVKISAHALPHGSSGLLGRALVSTRVMVPSLRFT